MQSHINKEIQLARLTQVYEFRLLKHFANFCCSNANALVVEIQMARCVLCGFIQIYCNLGES